VCKRIDLTTRYVPLAVSAGDFYLHHFNNRSAEGRVIVWPAQALEMWWCDFTPGTNGNEGYFSNCCEDDAPTVTGMMTVFSRLLALPESLTTAEQRAAWTAFGAIMPELPVSGGVILPARVLSNGTHNSEAPEFFAVHPHRLFTKGREVASGLDISLAVRTYNESKWKTANSGWNYAVNVAALLGLADAAAPMLLSRAATPPAEGCVTAISSPAACADQPEHPPLIHKHTCAHTLTPTHTHKPPTTTVTTTPTTAVTANATTHLSPSHSG
jgi:hypothetical protein